MSLCSPDCRSLCLHLFLSVYLSVRSRSIKPCDPPSLHLIVCSSVHLSVINHLILVLFNVSAQLQQTTRYQHEPIAVMCWHAFSDPVYITEVQSLKSIKLLYDSGIWQSCDHGNVHAKKWVGATEISIYISNQTCLKRDNYLTLVSYPVAVGQLIP